MTQEDSEVCCTSSGPAHCTSCLGTFCDLNLITAAESESNVEGVLRRSMARASGEAVFVSSGHVGWILLDSGKSTDSRVTEKLQLTLEEGIQLPLPLGLITFSAWRRIFPLVGGVIRNPTFIGAFPMSIPQSIASYFFLNQCSCSNSENTAKIQSLTNLVIQSTVSKNFPI